MKIDRQRKGIFTQKIDSFFRNKEARLLTGNLFDKKKYKEEYVKRKKGLIDI